MIKTPNFFHNRASVRRKTNAIRQLNRSDGQCITDERGIQELILQHFQGIFGNSWDNGGINWNFYMNHISSTLSSSALQVLNEPF